MLKSTSSQQGAVCCFYQRRSDVNRNTVGNVPASRSTYPHLTYLLAVTARSGSTGIPGSWLLTQNADTAVRGPRGGLFAREMASKHQPLTLASQTRFSEEVVPGHFLLGTRQRRFETGPGHFDLSCPHTQTQDRNTGNILERCSSVLEPSSRRSGTQRVRSGISHNPSGQEQRPFPWLPASLIGMCQSEQREGKD